MASFNLVTILAHNFGKHLKVDRYTQTVQLGFFHTRLGYRLHCFLPLHTTFTDLDLAWGHKASAKQNVLASFLAYFSTDQDEIWRGDEAIQIDHPEIIFE